MLRPEFELDSTSQWTRWLTIAATKAREAGQTLARSPVEVRNRALHNASIALRSNCPTILAANRHDLSNFDGAPAMLDRLALDEARVLAMARALHEIASLPDPIGREIESWELPNGLRIRKVAAPIGVIGMIYESRPNVGVDATGLCIKSGNALILRGGRESHATNVALQAVLQPALEQAGLPAATVQSSPTSNRELVDAMLNATGQLDLLIARGGKSPRRTSSARSTNPRAVARRSRSTSRASRSNTIWSPSRKCVRSAPCRIP